MNYRSTRLYKILNHYDACAIVEGFSGQEHTEKEILAAWQWLIDTGFCWHLQGWYGRTASDLVDRGLIRPPKQDHVNYYGGIVRGTGVR